LNLTQATFNGAQLQLPLSVAITTSTIVLSNATNILEIPNLPPSSGLTVFSVDASGSKVAESAFDTAVLVPNTPAVGINFAATRSNTAIQGVGSLSIAYTPRFPSVASTLFVTLPVNQMSLHSNGCQMQTGSLVSCQVLSSSSSSISIGFSNQSQTVLTKVTNLEPNNNLLTLKVLNSQG
jgi:hypothetical protein